MKKMLLLLLALMMLTGCGKSAGSPETFAETTAPGVSTPGDTAPPEDAIENEFTPDFAFNTTDREGNIWTEGTFQEHKLTILNFWEPWCGPCVMEMPDLQKLSEEYADAGLLILGIYATKGAEEDVDQTLEDTGAAYPILHYVSEFDFLQTGYVPMTIFVNQQGKILFKPFSGSLGYDDWVQIVEALL